MVTSFMPQDALAFSRSSHCWVSAWHLRRTRGTLPTGMKPLVSSVTRTRASTRRPSLGVDRRGTKGREIRVVRAVQVRELIRSLLPQMPRSPKLPLFLVIRVPQCNSDADHQPAKTDGVWEGNDDGVIMLQTCRHVDEGFVGLVTTLYWAATEEDAPPEAPTVTPEQLAQEALARLQVPKPQFHRSPPETAEWRGTPYTWISIPTWFWVTTSWTPLEETARLGSVWATVSVTPERLIVDGGDGGEPTQCDGPGVPHPESSSTSDQSLAEVDVPADACTYVYSQVAEGVTPEVTIVWSASWQGSGGTGADLPTAMTTAVGDAMAVLQIETVIE